MLYRLLVFLCVLALASCIDNKDYTLDSLTITPTVAFPLASGEVSILDMVSDKDSAYLKTYLDGGLYFSYSQTLASLDIRNLFNLPNTTTPVPFDLIPGTLPISSSDTFFGTINKEIDLNLAPEKLTEMLVKSGSLNYTIGVSQPTSPNTLPYEVTVTFADIINKNTLAPLVITSTGGIGSKPLQDYRIQMNSNKFNAKVDLVLKARPNAIFVPVGTKLNVQLTFASLDFVYIRGFLGDQPTTLPDQAMDLTVFSSSLKKSKVVIAQPVVKLSVRNENGVPTEITFTRLEAKKTGATLPFQITPSSPITVGFPSTLGNSTTTTINVNNAAALLDFPANQFAYSAIARINKNLSSGSNFLSDTSKLNITMSAEVPLYGQASGISMSDTLELDLGSLNESSVINSALKIKSVNEMPMDAYIQMYLADKDHHVLDSIFTNNQTYLVKGSAVTAGGDLQTAGSTDLKLDLSDQKVSQLFSSSYLIIKCRLNTSKDTNGVPLNVKFKAAYKLKLNIGLLAKLKITAK